MDVNPIFCENIRRTDTGDEKCGRYVGVISDELLNAMRIIGKEAYVIMRCPSCPSGSKMVMVCGENGQLAYQTITEELRFRKKIQFDRIDMSQQVG